VLKTPILFTFHLAFDSCKCYHNCTKPAEVGSPAQYVCTSGHRCAITYVARMVVCGMHRGVKPL